jgi:branched-chain amino acid transport system ATP-binding protein
MALLEVQDMHSYYGSIHALRGVSLTVEEGEVVTLIGSNGAGKTTTLRSINGVLPAREGKVIFDGEEIQAIPAHDMIKKGIAQSPEGRKIFSRMTVRENL